MVTRRGFLTLALAGAAGTGLAARGIQVTTDAFALTTHTLSYSGLPEQFHGYRIGVISDIHYGPWVPDEWVIKVFGMLNAERPDLVLIAGDHCNVADSNLSRLLWIQRNHRFAPAAPRKMAAPILERLGFLIRDLGPFKDGCAAVLGNHEGWIGPELCRRSFAEAGVPLLVNKSRIIQRGSAALRVIGVDDYWTGIPHCDCPAAVEEGREFRILLAHNPDYISEVLHYNICRFHLGVAGHTHGGQIRLPGLGALTYNIQDPRFNCGLAWASDECAVFTSAGTGVVEVPHRINCLPEVSILELRRKDS